MRRVSAWRPLRGRCRGLDGWLMYLPVRVRHLRFRPSPCTVQPLGASSALIRSRLERCAERCDVGGSGKGGFEKRKTQSRRWLLRLSFRPFTFEANSPPVERLPSNLGGDGANHRRTWPKVWPSPRLVRPRATASSLHVAVWSFRTYEVLGAVAEGISSRNGGTMPCAAAYLHPRQGFVRAAGAEMRTLS